MSKSRQALLGAIVTGDKYKVWLVSKTRRRIFERRQKRKARLQAELAELE